MSTSLRSGLRVLVASVEAALVVLADQPRLTPALIEALVARYAATQAPAVAPFYSDRRGNPVLFDRALFAELAAVEGDEGGRAVLSRYEAKMERVEVDDPALLADVDTRQDYEASVRQSERAA